MAWTRRNENESVIAWSTSSLMMGRDVAQPTQKHKTMMDTKRRMMANVEVYHGVERAARNGVDTTGSL